MMNALLAGMTLALAAQLAEPNRYGQPADASPATSPASAGNELHIAEEPSAPTETPTVAPPAASRPDVAAHAPKPQQLQPAPTSGAQPDPAPPQRSVLAPFAKPSDLMRQLMDPPAGGQLSGASVTLGEAVREARDRQDQTARAKAYWDLAAAVADYYLAILENTELNVLRQSVAAPAKQWADRLQDAQSRVAVAQRAAQGAQLRLQQQLGRPAVNSLPLPADVPHCGRYNAEYEDIFAARPNPIARQLSELMPLRYADLRSQAQAVADAAAWRDEVSRRRDPADDGLELLQSQDLLSLKRRTFNATACDYNHEIAEYTELAAPAEVPADRLVAMMIRTSAATDDLPWQSSGVRQATAEEPALPDVSALPPSPDSNPVQGAYGQQAASNDGVREVRRPLQRLLDRDREHSIVSRFRKLRDRIDERIE